MRGLMILVFLAVISAVGVSSRHAQPKTVEARLQLAADKMNAKLPLTLEPGVKLTSVRAEGKVMHFRMTGVPDWRDDMSNDEAQRALAGVLCHSGHTSMIDDGATLKVELQTPGGAWLPELTIDHC